MPRLCIENLENPLLDPFRMVRDRDLAGRADVFMLEGRVVLEAALVRGRFAIESVLVSQKRVAALEDLLNQVPQEVPIYIVPHALMINVVGFHIHRGLLATAKRVTPPTASRLLATLSPGPATILMLEGLNNTDNVGSCFRNAAGLGAHAILLDKTCCDPLYRKAVRVSAGYALSVPYSRDASMLEAMQSAKEAGFITVALCLSPRAVQLHGAFRPGERVALILGTEGAGLRQEVLDAADLHLCIPMQSGVDSLNVATAGAIALYALQNSP